MSWPGSATVEAPPPSPGLPKRPSALSPIRPTRPTAHGACRVPSRTSGSTGGARGAGPPTPPHPDPGHQAWPWTDRARAAIAAGDQPRAQALLASAEEAARGSRVPAGHAAVLTTLAGMAAEGNLPLALAML